MTAFAFSWTIVAVLFAVLFGVLMGWSAAQGSVATECERLGSFYVGSRVFECRQKNGEHK